MEVPAKTAPVSQPVSTEAKETEILIADETERLSQKSTTPAINEPVKKTSKGKSTRTSPKKASSETETDASTKDKPEVISVVMKPTAAKPTSQPECTAVDPKPKSSSKVAAKPTSQIESAAKDPKPKSSTKIAAKSTSQSESTKEDPKPKSPTKIAAKSTFQSESTKEDPKPKSSTKAAAAKPTSQTKSTKEDPKLKSSKKASSSSKAKEVTKDVPAATTIGHKVAEPAKDVASVVLSVSNKENVTPPATDVGKAKPKSSTTSQPVSLTKKSDVSVPILNLPTVQPIEKGTTLRMMRNRPRIPRNTQRSHNTSNSVQNVLQQMVGGPQRTGVPCGRCDCCRSLLTYVTVLRNFMDHIVSGMAQGANIEEEAANLPPPPCTLCEVQHVEHVDHTPKSTVPAKDTPVMERPVTQQQVQSESQNQTTQGQIPSSTKENQPRQNSSYAPGHTHQFPHHNQGSWQTQGQSSTIQSQNWIQSRQQPSQSPNQQNQSPPSQGQNWNQQNQSPPSQGQNWNQQSQSPSQGQTSSQQPNQSNAPQLHQHGHHEQTSTSPRGQSSQDLQRSGGSAANTQSSLPGATTNTSTSESVNTWSTFTDPNAPKPQQNRPRRMENVAWGGTRRQQSEDDNMTSETPITETTQYPTGSPTKGHVEQYDEEYTEDDYEDEDYEIETNHAFVTLATDNETALLCMVLGNSLLLSGTTKTLVVLVTEDVSPHMRYLLSTIYNNVENVDMMQSPGTTSLALLEQPDLGVSFTKLLIWGIENFDKGVFLDPNTLVVQNCDELFDRDELSAVPDIGWPDCFNSDVFVYKPSMDTFWSLLGCAEDQDSFDGGDQGLLNMYFRDWSRNISKKLPFLYNLMANVNYTYKPAFKQFGSQVKIVNFFGSYKPVNVQFHSATGQMAPDSNVHPTYAQFVYYWLEIFTKRVLPLFSQEIHDFVDNQEYASAMDVLKFFPSNARKRKESLPTPPSFRVYADSNLDRPRRRSAVEINREELETDDQVGLAGHDQIPISQASQEEEQTTEPVEERPAVPRTMPGSEVGNYQDMAAWEHGRMDYLGSHSSDNIMARLSYFMNKPPSPQT